MPYHKFFQQLFSSDPKKLKILNYLMNEEKVSNVFSPEIENQKEIAFGNFKEDIRQKAASDNLANISFSLDTLYNGDNDFTLHNKSNIL